MLDNKGFDLWADGYDRSVGLSDDDNTYPFAGYKKILASIYDAIRAGQGKRVLDIGFGTGVLACKLYENGYNITGIDFSDRMIQIAQKKMPFARLIQHDFTNGLPEDIQDQKFDAIVCTYAIHHLDDAAKIGFMKELQTHLNPSGQIYIGDVAFSSRQELEECRAQCGDEWDDEEFYIVAEEIAKVIPGVHFEKMSHCAGVLSVPNMTCRMMMGQTAKQVRTYTDTRNFEEGMRFAERALQKYPNSFDVVYESALHYFMSMIHYRGKSAQRAIELFERSIDLIDQNTRETVGVITIQNQIASCYCYLGNMEKAVDVLKQNNIGGLNDAKIGLFLSQDPEKAEESLGYLSDALHNYYARIYEICIGYANAYSAMEKLEPIEDMMHWLLHMGWGLKRPDAVNIIDKTDVRIYTILAEMRMLQGDEVGAEKWLREAKRTALRFDANPQYRTAHGMKYYHSSEKSMSYDDMGDTGMAMIENYMADEVAGKNLRPLWAKIQAEG